MRLPASLNLNHLKAGVARLKLPKLLLGRKQSTSLHGQLIAEVTSELNAAMQAMEESFVDVGDRLEQLDTCSRSLIGKCERLLHLAAGSDEGEVLLHDSLEVLKEPLAYIDFCMSRHEQLLELLAQCEEKTQAMLGIRGRMHDAIAPLTFMAVMFKIESAYLADEHKETFLTVTAEVERLHHLVDETFAQNAKQLELAHTTLASVRGRLEADFRKHATDVAGKRSRIDSSIGSLQHQLEQNPERDMRLHDHSTQLTTEVSKIVMGVQFQDIVKQKCDHVLEALEHASGDTGTWAQTLALQTRQLESVTRDMDEGRVFMQDGLGRIEHYTEQLNHSTVSLENIESMTAAMDGMVQLLLDTLADVDQIIRMVADLMIQGHEAVLPASGLARNLTSTIVELSMNMQLIALNAQIRSVQSGQGTGLELLAARTAEISSEIDGISQDISRDLGELHEAIDEMLGMFNEFRQRGADQLSALAVSRGPTEVRLHALRDATILAIQDIGAEIDSMQAAIQGVHTCVDLIPGHAEAINQTKAILEAGMPELGTLNSAEAESLKARLDRYTMASEREIHEAYIAEAGMGASAAGPTATGPNSGSGSAEDILFSPEEKSPPSPAMEDVDLKKTKESKLSSPALPSQPTSPSTGGSNLGDNVELF